MISGEVISVTFGVVAEPVLPRLEVFQAKEPARAAMRVIDPTAVLLLLYTTITNFFGPRPHKARHEVEIWGLGVDDDDLFGLLYPG